MPRLPEDNATETPGENPHAANSNFDPALWLLVLVLTVITGLLIVWCNPPRDATGEASIRGGEFYNPDPGGSPELAPSVDSRKSELVRVVDAQLSAFRKNDYLKAYTYAAAGIRSQFSLRTFERMVKMGYPAIAQSRSAAFGATLDNGVQALVNVGITDGSGKVFYYYRYHLLREKSGWKIGGVEPIRLKSILARIQVSALAGG